MPFRKVVTLPTANANHKLLDLMQAADPTYAASADQTGRLVRELQIIGIDGSDDIAVGDSAMAAVSDGELLAPTGSIREVSTGTYGGGRIDVALIYLRSAGGAQRKCFVKAHWG